MIEDVLLTVYEVNEHFDKPRATEYELLRKQCLKLLDWLKGQCTEHSDRKSNNGQCRRMDCPQCISELESKLKEG